MEQQYRKWVHLSYLFIAALLAYIVFTFAFHFVGVYDLEAKFQDIDLAVRGLSVFVGALAFIILYKNDKANQFMSEVVVELSRVTWPSQNDTVKGTIVVVIMVLISGFILGGLDGLWAYVMKWII